MQIDVCECYLDLLFYHRNVCTAVEINTEPEHAHLMFVLSRTEPLSMIVGQMKTGSSGWLQKQLPELQKFHWQNGYGAFS